MTDPRPPFTVGKFEILRELGRGGMGVVYEALDTALRRPCALKFMLPVPGLDASSARLDQARFLREAGLCANLPRHPFIVHVFEAGLLYGKPYFAMELVKGRPMADWRKDGRVTLRRQVALLRDVLMGVQYAHEHGIVHRDLKPQNVLVDDGDKPHLVDFGLAKTLGKDLSLSLTATGSLVGTPHYMSPEQAVNSKGIDARTDIWSVGVMLYEALSGRLPFPGDSAFDVLMKITKQVVPTPSSVIPPGTPREWDPALERICLKALAKDPAHRYAAAREFSADLARWLEGGEVLATPPRRYTMWRIRKTHVLGAGGAAAGLLLLLSALLLLPDRGQREREQDLRRLEAELERTKTAVSPSPPGPPAPAPEPPPPESEQRRREREFVRRIESSGHAALQAADRPPFRSLAGHGDLVQGLRFADNGRTLFSCGADKTVRRWDLETGYETCVITRHAGAVRALDLDAGQKRLASADYDGVLLLSDAATGAEIRAFPRQPKFLEAVAFSPDGRTLATAGRDEKVKLWDVETGAERASLDAGSPAMAAAFSPDGAVLAAGTQSGELRFWSFPGLEPLAGGHGHRGWIRQIVFDPSGERLVAAGNHPVPTLWSAKDRRLAVHLVGHGAQASVAAFGPEGGYVVTGGHDATLRLWSAATGLELRTVAGLKYLVSAVCLSPDGRTLAVGGYDRRIHLWLVEELFR